MSLSDLASLGSFVSGFAVLISLIYLTLQVRQNTKHSRALIQQGRSIQSADFTNRWASDVDMIKQLLRGAVGDVTMDDVQTMRFLLMQYSSFYMWEDQFYQHREGLLDDERYSGMVGEMTERLRTVGYRSAWRMVRHGFGQQFGKFVDSLVGEIHAAGVGPTLPSMLWKAAVEEEQFGRSLRIPTGV